MKLGELLNYKINKKNKQESFDIRKLKLKKNNLSVNDILEIDIKKSMKRFKDGEC